MDRRRHSRRRRCICRYRRRAERLESSEWLEKYKRFRNRLGLSNPKNSLYRHLKPVPRHGSFQILYILQFDVLALYPPHNVGGLHAGIKTVLDGNTAVAATEACIAEAAGLGATFPADAAAYAWQAEQQRRGKKLLRQNADGAAILKGHAGALGGRYWIKYEAAARGDNPFLSSTRCHECPKNWPGKPPVRGTGFPLGREINKPGTSTTHAGAIGWPALRLINAAARFPVF
ncbi:hypothetical protein BGS_0465 [Beggiatoa sp. SS]|nr:hypothetical protein BGS_0465 [Beggiatoa sp. SS]